VGLDVVLGGMLGVLGSVSMVTMGEVGMVRSRFVVPVLMMSGGFAVVACSVLVVLRCVRVVLCCFVRHVRSCDTWGIDVQIRIIRSPCRTWCYRRAKCG
jgi:hypothetical protein